MRYISLGVGVQSSALIVASDRGLHNVPRADFAVFADTQDEPKYVYEYLEYLRDRVSIPIEVVTAGKLSKAEAGFLRIPAFTMMPDGSASILRRQCTAEFKIKPIQRWVRARGHTRKNPAVAMLGISLDEAHRMKPSLVQYTVNTYPLVDERMDRQDCIKLLTEQGFKTPGKSACVFCPFHSDGYWKNLKQNLPDEWAVAVAYDAQIRDSTRAGVKRPAFLHRSCVPLAQVDLNESQQEMFGNECSGLCGV